MNVVHVLVLAAAVYGAWQVVSRWVFPFGPCPACKGRPGKGPGSNSERWNVCRRCGGSGRRNR